jgi:diguanylate cyclase (GGDEF)-like protein/PAS domain S-box-containing protein
MDATAEEEARRWRRRAERERQARLEAETIAEQATRNLYENNIALDAANQQLTTSETLYRGLFARNPLPMYVVACDTLQFLEVNETAIEHYGFSRAEFLDMTLRDIEPMSALGDADARRMHLQPTERDSGLWRHVTRDGRSIEVELTIHTAQWNGRTAWLLVARDVTEQHRDQRALQLRNQAIEASHNGVFICSMEDAEFPIRYLNAAMERLCGRSRQALLGQPFAELFGSASGADDAAQMASALQAGRSAQAVIVTPGARGASLWLEVQVTPVPDDSGAIRHWIGIVQDATERKALEKSLAYRAHHDELTGLPNRILLRERFDEALKAAERAAREIAVLFLDFDKFKQINDIGGHEAGDHYLKTLSRRISGCVRRGDLLARVGGDEFVLITTGANRAETALTLATRIQTAFAQPVHFKDQCFSAHCSIGIALYPAAGGDAETLLKRADLAMYTAKRKGGNLIEWFSEPMEADFHKRLGVEAALKRALRNDEFELHYQPQLDMRRQVVVGLEALLRWPKADAAYRGPADFIPIAEEAGLIDAIGGWVLERACRDLAALRKSGHGTLSMAVNVSAVQLRAPDFAEKIADLLARYQLPPSALELEITESVLMAEYDNAESALHALEGMGVRLAIDDFGTGYSSLSYLRRLPIHRLKIDRSFIREMGQSVRARELVRAVANMAHNLKLEPFAEGVETDLEMQTLLGYECFLAQGFHFSHPLPMEQLTALLADRQAA